MSLKLKLVIIGIVVLLFSGCVPSYSIKPFYDKNTKIVTIGTLKLHNAKEVLKRSPANSEFLGNVTSDIRKYSFRNAQCNSLFYSGISTNGGVFLTDSFSESLEERYKKNLDCEVLEISNLKFYECSGSPIRWFIGYSTPNANGYSSMESLEVDNICYKTIKEHFRLKAISDKVKLKAYHIPETLN